MSSDKRDYTSDVSVRSFNEESKGFDDGPISNRRREAGREILNIDLVVHVIFVEM